MGQNLLVPSHSRVAHHFLRKKKFKRSRLTVISNYPELSIEITKLI
jgi:hypothetical protein